MTSSINTNVGAMVALQNLSTTSSQLSGVENIISTGLKIASAKDNGAIYAIAQSQRSTVSSLDAVTDSLNRASSVVDVASAAGNSVADLLNQLKTKALAASDTSLDTTSRNALQSDFNSIRDQITSTINNASFNGINLVNGGNANITALANAKGTGGITVSGENLSLGGSIVTLATTASFATATSAANLLTTLDTSIDNVSSSLAKLGTSSTALQSHITFVGQLQNSLTAGIGNLVDANMAEESAKLQALQTKQQLGVQALSLANQSTSTVLSLFR